MRKKITIFALLMNILAVLAVAQDTEFTYQGSLKDGASAATGSYDFEFRLYDSGGGGSQLGSTISRSGVSVADGTFSVKLDFGNAFPGSNRYLEIAVRSSGGAGFTMLSPRQKIDSSPYAVKSLNAENATNAVNAANAANATNATNATTAATADTFTGNLAGDVTGTQASTTVARLRGRNVAPTQPNSGQVLKFNTTNSQWEPANDETGSGGGGGTITGVTAGAGLTGGGTTGSVTVGIANGGINTTQLADNSVTDAKIVGVAGAKVSGAVANATNAENATTAANATQLGGIPSTGFIQNTANQQVSSNFNISGNGTAAGILKGNVVHAATEYRFGSLGGYRLIFSNGNGLYIGIDSGESNTGFANTFVGNNAGKFNVGGFRNTFFGSKAGEDNISGNDNTFAGSQAGEKTTSSGNSFFGAGAGLTNVGGDSNSFFGASAGVANATGARNSIFGRFAGDSNVQGNDNAFFGSSAGGLNVSGNNNSFFGRLAGQRTIGSDNSFVGFNSGDTNTTGANNAALGSNADMAVSGLNYATAIGSGSTVSTNDTVVLGRAADTVQVPGSLNVAGSITGSFTIPAGSTNYIQNTTSPQPSSNFSISGNGLIGGNVGIGTTAPIRKLDILYGGGQGVRIKSEANFATLDIDAVTDSLIRFYRNSAQQWLVGNSSSDDFEISEAGGGLRMAIRNGTGNVGIGTSSPAAKVHVVGGSDASLIGGGYIINGTTTGLNLVIDNNEIMVRNNGGTESLALNAAGGDVHLIQSGTGRVGIGTASPEDKLDVNGDIRIGTSGTNGCLKGDGGATITGTCSSDERFKREITPFPSVLNSFSKLRPVHYFFRSQEFPDKHFGPDQTYGLLAQDVEKVLPELVSTDAQGFKQIDYGKLPMLTIQAVKELNEQNGVLKAEINEQKIRIAALTMIVCASNITADICKEQK